MRSSNWPRCSTTPPKNSLADADAYADHARWVPLLGRDERQEIRARNAALQYWTEGL